MGPSKVSEVYNQTHNRYNGLYAPAGRNGPGWTTVGARPPLIGRRLFRDRDSSFLKLETVLYWKKTTGGNYLS